MDVWYDQIDTTDNYYKYQFKPPTGNGDIYMTVETYGSMIVPLDCTTGTRHGIWSNSPRAHFMV